MVNGMFEISGIDGKGKQNKLSYKEDIVPNLEKQVFCVHN